MRASVNVREKYQGHSQYKFPGVSIKLRAALAAFHICWDFRHTLACLFAIRRRNSQLNKRLHSRDFTCSFFRNSAHKMVILLVVDDSGAGLGNGSYQNTHGSYQNSQQSHSNSHSMTTTKRLPIHIDLSYFKSLPGALKLLQFVSCLEFHYFYAPWCLISLADFDSHYQNSSASSLLGLYRWTDFHSHLAVDLGVRVFIAPEVFNSSELDWFGGSRAVTITTVFILVLRHATLLIIFELPGILLRCRCHVLVSGHDNNHLRRCLLLCSSSCKCPARSLVTVCGSVASLINHFLLIIIVVRFSGYSLPSPSELPHSSCSRIGRSFARTESRPQTISISHQPPISAHRTMRRVAADTSKNHTQCA